MFRKKAKEIVLKQTNTLRIRASRRQIKLEPGVATRKDSSSQNSRVRINKIE